MGIKALLLCVKGSLCNLSVYVYSASKRKEKKTQQLSSTGSLLKAQLVHKIM